MDKKWSYQIRLLTSDNTYLQAELHVWEIDKAKQTMKFILEYDGKEIETISSSYFWGLHPVRLELEKEGLLLVCYGASRNVWTSGMAESMGLSFKVYKLTLGQHPNRNDLVIIFNDGPDVDPVTLAEQKAFHSQWIESVRRK